MSNERLLHSELINAARESSGKSYDEILKRINEAGFEFGKDAHEKQYTKGEW